MPDLHLLLGQEVAGTVSRTPTGSLSFTYDSGYVARKSATPISVSMPLQVAVHTDRQISPWLWGLLPDNDAVLNRWAREFQVSTRSPFALLATPLGEDCPGAVQLIPPDRLDAVRTDPPSAADIDWLTEAQVAQRLRDLKTDSTAWLGASRTGRFSLAGAQAKTALFRDGQRWGQPLGALATSHILKPAITGLDDHDLNEHLCLSAMRAAGLQAVQTWIERFEDQSAIVVRRYDRSIRGDEQIRTHQEDLCQALGVHPENKYQNQGGPGPREIAELFRRVMPRAAAREATEAFLDALVWNWVIAGTDAHAKNYSLLLSKREVILAPFYDVASALPYDIAEQKPRLAMKFGNDYRINPGNSPWRHLATALQLPEDVVRSRAGSVIAVVPDAFSTAAADPAMQALGSSLPQRLVNLVAARATRCAKYLQ
ncbi:type II toxin-antitoxin system HipA family toxin [Streptomyces sp. SID13031]|uniref:type II toxin-antitoxin system HipA family toxin n=1 Tax=Streptomyces sp. SID13031 TaxID=2706046 RepID=UPI0013C68FE3|nr:type II toxin-antitoxin system HipA family toxin [Streptomyces sp. SID13031]NEA36172.1 type II toxin-antitoxin system HipA family toxin [Streptomyces sp. SID13031]